MVSESDSEDDEVMFNHTNGSAVGAAVANGVSSSSSAAELKSERA